MQSLFAIIWTELADGEYVTQSFASNSFSEAFKMKCSAEKSFNYKETVYWGEIKTYDIRIIKD